VSVPAPGSSALARTADSVGGSSASRHLPATAFPSPAPCWLCCHWMPWTLPA